MNRWFKWIWVMPVAVVLAGCGSGGGGNAGGGGGNGGGGASSSDSSRQAASISTVQAVSILVDGGGFFGGAASGRSAAASGEIKISDVIAAMNRSTQLHGGMRTRSTSLNYLAGYNLYYSASLVSSNQASLQFYTDAAGTQSAGYGTINLASSSSATLTYTLTAGTFPGSANLSITVNSGGSSGSLSGTIYDSLTGASYSFNPININGSTLTGSMSVSSGGLTVTLNNINCNLNAGTLSANYTVSPGNWTGTVNVNSDGSGSLSLNDGSGTTNVQWTASGSATITFPDGSQTTVQNIYSAQP